MWQSECVRIIRHLIGDFGSPPDYDDERLQELFLMSAQYVYQEAKFINLYTIDVDELLLSPDPTDRAANTRDDPFINLSCLKSACVLDVSEARQYVKQGISFREYSSSVDMRGRADGKIKLLGVGACKIYKDMLFTYQANTGILGGAAIQSPMRVAIYSNWNVGFLTNLRNW